MAPPSAPCWNCCTKSGTKQSLEEARNLFDGLRSPRKEPLGQLLSCCASVKAVRLFLTWARKLGQPGGRRCDLLAHYPVRTGSDKRWMSRLDDGTLLSLNLMDKTYADTVRLLLAVAPDVFANDIFAMKGGTAINLFVRDMPRLSVDIDVVYRPWQTPRDEALQAINQGAGRHRHARSPHWASDAPGSRSKDLGTPS